MSKETFEKLEEAIREHIQDVAPGHLLTDWALMTASATDSHARTFYYAEYSDSPHHSMLGLTKMLHQDVVQQGEP